MKRYGEEEPGRHASRCEDVGALLAPREVSARHEDDRYRYPQTATTTAAATATSNKSVKFDVIRQQRQTTILAPEFMSATRRTRLRLRPSEVQTVEHLSVSHVLHLQDPETKKALYRYVEGLDRPEDEDSYFHTAASGTAVRLVTAGLSHNAWQCDNIIGFLPVPPSPEGGGTVYSYQRELCHYINSSHVYQCNSCGKPKPNLRHFFVRLRRIAMAMKAQRNESLKRLHHCDYELTRHEDALAEARMKLVRLRERNEQRSLLNEGCGNDVDEEENDWNTMDIDLAQNGVWQRIDVHSLVPILVSNCHRFSNQLRQIRTELAVLVQSTYEMAAPHVQKVIRGHLTRTALDSMRRMLMHLARFAAAVEIQRVLRSLLAKREKQRRYHALCNASAIRIQSYARRKLAYMKYHRLWKEYIDELHRIMAMRIQAFYRNWKLIQMAKRIADELRRQREEMERAKLAKLRNDAAILIQSWLRRHHAKWVVHDKRIEIRLNYRLLKLADRFMIDGDLWQFLKCIDEDYRRYEDGMMDILEREDLMATTFVSKVTRFREDQHDSAWNEYENLCSRLRELRPETKKKSPQNGFDGLAPAQPTISRGVTTPLSSSPPPRRSLVRALRSLSIKDSTMMTKEENKDIHSREPGDRFSMYREETSQLRPCRQQRKRWASGHCLTHNDSTGKETISSIHMRRHDEHFYESNDAKVDNHLDVEEDLLRHRQNKMMQLATKEACSNHEQTVASGGKCASTPAMIEMEWQSDRCREMDRMGFSLLASTHFPSGGDILRRDLPSGLDDTLERFLHVASLRSYQPQSSQEMADLNAAHNSSTEFATIEMENTNGKDGKNRKEGKTNKDGKSGHQIYLDLPPGLNKIQLESVCYDRIKPLVSKLHHWGYTHIRQLLPRDKLLSTIESLEYKPDVVTDEFVRTCDHLLSQLQTADRLRLGFRTKLMKKYNEMVTNKRMVISQEPPNGESTHYEERNSMIRIAQYFGDNENDGGGLPGGLWIQANEQENGIGGYGGCLNHNGKEEKISPKEDESKSIAEAHPSSDFNDADDFKNIDGHCKNEARMSLAVENARDTFRKEMDHMVNDALSNFGGRGQHKFSNDNISTPLSSLSSNTSCCLDTINATDLGASDNDHNDREAIEIYPRQHANKKALLQGNGRHRSNKKEDTQGDSMTLKGGLFYPTKRRKEEKKKKTKYLKRVHQRHYTLSKKDKKDTPTIIDGMTQRKQKKYGGVQSWVVPYTRRILKEARQNFPIYDQCRYAPQIATDLPRLLDLEHKSRFVADNKNELQERFIEVRDEHKLVGKYGGKLSEGIAQKSLPKDLQIDLEHFIARNGAHKKNS